MDKLEKYRNAIKNILIEYYEMTTAKIAESRAVETSNRLAFKGETRFKAEGRRQRT